MKQHHRRRPIALALAAGLALSLATPPPAAGDDAPREPAHLAGFGDIRLPASVVRGPVHLAARRAWVWRIPEPEGSQTPVTIRVVLDGDVDTLLGVDRLSARRASLWIHPRPEGDATESGRTYEIFGYYSDASSSGGAISFTAKALPVEAAIASPQPLRMKVDLRLPGPPEPGTPAADFLADADAAFARMKDRILHPDANPEQAEPAMQPPAWLLERLRGVNTQPDRRQPSSAEATPPESGTQPAATTSPPPRPGPGRSIPFSPDHPAGTPAEPASTPPPAPTTPSTEQPPSQPGRLESPPPGPSPTEASLPPTTTPPIATDTAGTTEEPAASTPRLDRIFSSRGVFFISAGDRVTVQRGDDANAVTLTGGVVLQYEGADRVMEMTAQRAVIFLDPGPLSESIGRFDVAEVRGIYLESGVRVTDGDYTLRSPRVYYDVRADRAILLDAVFRTYDDRHRMPLYMRAKVIRQEAADRFSAEKSVYANSAFATPHLAIGTSKMTITRRTHPGGDTSNIVDARGITLRGGGVPFFWWPRLKGDPERFPLRSIGLTDSNRTGTVFSTTWDPFTLLGIKRPDGLGADVNLDYYADRGIGLGTRLDWNTPAMNGGLFAYMLPEDTGTDVLRNGAKISRDGEFRGIAALKHRWRFRPDWTLWLNGFTASDESVMPALFRRMGEDSEEFTNRGYLRRLKGNSFLTLEAKAASTDFVPNDNTAQAPGYMVDKLPEISVGRIGDDLLDRWAPGRLTHTWNATVSRIRFRLPEITPRDLGLNRSSRSQRGFGLEPDVAIGDGFRAVGLDESFVTRLDTRQELSTTFDVGPVHVNPFIVGRATAYDSRFENFSLNESDRLRLWGSAGVNLTTSIYRIDDSVSSDMFDLNRMRHIIEPGVTLWHAGSTIDEADLPVFDDDVESLAQGTSIRVGVNQTWQTKRGAPGRWRTVDVFTLDTEYVWFSGDTNRSTPIGRFFSSRPELSAPDEFVRVAGTWQVTEVLGLAGETIWDTNTQREDRNSLGMILRHSEDLTTRFELRRLEAQDDTFGSGSLRGTFGDKYVYSLIGTYNFRLDDFQRFTLSLLRRFPNGLIGGRVTYNNISGETTLGIYIQPNGLPGAGLSGGGSGSRF